MNGRAASINCARAWWRSNRDDSTLAHGLAVIADGVESLRSLLDEALERACGGGQSHARRKPPANRTGFTCDGRFLPARNDWPSSTRGWETSFQVWAAACRSSGRRCSEPWTSRTGFSSISSTRASGGPMMRRMRSTVTAMPILGSVSLGCFVTDVLRTSGISTARRNRIQPGRDDRAARFASLEPAGRDAASAQVVAAVSDRAGRPMRCRTARLGDTRGRAEWTGSPALFLVRSSGCAVPSVAEGAWKS